MLTLVEQEKMFYNLGPGINKTLIATETFSMKA